jgi:Tfp pilus assembly pilus retraction ATPase PilT
MQTMNAELARLVRKGLVSKTDALGRSPDPEGLQKSLARQ